MGEKARPGSESGAQAAKRRRLVRGPAGLFSMGFADSAYPKSRLSKNAGTPDRK